MLITSLEGGQPPHSLRIKKQLDFPLSACYNYNNAYKKNSAN